MRALLVLALVALVSGCIRVGEGDDVRDVCERRSGSPWRPYPPDVVAALTAVEGDLPEAARAAVFQAAADSLVTPGGAPYRAFEARLFEDGHGTWRFVANGTWSDEGRDGMDEYDLLFVVEGGKVASAPPTDVVPAPAWLRGEAEAAARRSAEAGADLPDPEGLPVARWHEEAPSCVQLAGPRGSVWVNVLRGQVVHVERSARA